MRKPLLSAALLAVLLVPFGIVSGQDRQILGGLSVEIDGEASELEIFRGPIDGFIRSMAGYRTNFGGDGGLVQIEALPREVPTGAHPMQGAVTLHMEFSAPAPLTAESPHDDASLFLISEWSAADAIPSSAFANAKSVQLTLDRLDFTEGREQVAGTASATMCPYDLETETVDRTSEACFDMAVSFTTTLHRFSAAIPIDTETQTAGASVNDHGATPDEPVADSGSGSATMEVLGDVVATLDGEEREWLTIAGRIRGQDVVSATWERYTIPIPTFADTLALGDFAERLPEEERAQVDRLDDLLGQMTGQRRGGPEHFNLTISGFDPTSPNILTEQVLTLDIHLATAEPPLGRPLPVDITYIVEGSGRMIPTLFYISGEGGHYANVTFDRLVLDADDGHASGRFAGTLCRMEGARLMEGADLSDCMTVEGRFDTALVEE